MTGTYNYSLIICTYNRSNAVCKLIEQLITQIKLEQLHAELIIINNNSTDDTQSKIFQFQENFIKYFCETEQGSSAARNRGIKEANAEMLIFLDDDISLEENFCKQLKLIDQNKIYGGKVIADWQAEKPEWINFDPPFDINQSCFPSHDFGENNEIYPFKYKKYKTVTNPISACFICPKSIFEKYGNFRLDLGIHGNSRGACEDTEFFWRLIAAGEKISYRADLIVHHPIDAKRMTKDFILAWYELLGKTLKYMREQNLLHLQKNKKSFLKTLVKKVYLFTIELLAILSFNSRLAFWVKCQNLLDKPLSFLLKP
jgi:glycosyltransferase involved in cell wall biosynthesis